MHCLYHVRISYFQKCLGKKLVLFVESITLTIDSLEIYLFMLLIQLVSVKRLQKKEDNRISYDTGNENSI